MRTLLALFLAAPLAAQPSTVRTEVTPDLAVYLATVPADGADTSVCETWHGIDGGEPEVIASAGWVEHRGRRLALDVSCMELTLGARLYDVAAEPVEGTDNVRVSGTFSDGAGTAAVAWLVGPAGTVRTLLVSGPHLQERQRWFRADGRDALEVAGWLDMLADGLVELRGSDDADTAALVATLYAVLLDIAARLGD